MVLGVRAENVVAGITDGLRKRPREIRLSGEGHRITLGKYLGDMVFQVIVRIQPD
jgi:hypothetical protein